MGDGLALNLNCDVCNARPAIGVYCCGFDAMSLGYCRECLDRRAEPEWGLLFLLYEVADGDQSNLSHSVRFSTWKDGKYFAWDEWMATDPQRPEACHG